MSLEPRMVLNGTDEHASRRKRKDELAARVEELGLFGKIKNLVTGKGFHDDAHPRGSDGRFARKGSIGKAIEGIKPGVDSIKAQQNYKKNLAALHADMDQWLKDATGQWVTDVASAKAANDAAQNTLGSVLKQLPPNGGRGDPTALFKAQDAARKAATDAFNKWNDLKQSKPSLADYPKEREAKFPLS